VILGTVLKVEDIITDIDLRQRVEEEWEMIYHLRIEESDYSNSDPMDELEWCYYLMNHCKYYRIPNTRKGKVVDNWDDYSIADEMEARAMKINCAIFNCADKYEKKLLNEGKFVATKYVLKRRTS
jgi:hypothetical protein